MVDPLLLAGYLCSRLCHDLVGPVGAVVNGAELLSDAGDDEELREQSVDLLGESAEELSGRLRFFRIAFGAVSDETTIGREEFFTTLNTMVRGRRIAAEIQGELADVVRSEARFAYLMVLIGVDCLPRGGRMVLRSDGRGGAGGGWEIEMSGLRCGLPEAHGDLLAGKDAEVEARTAPTAFVLALARAAGRALTVASDEDSVTLALA
ncbi:histidine phosphotransferase family protein [Zavarzinia compransoris]|uniref:histidine phosphotransferase family protein n=1 Tax=Zavarzinia marina TaxID=2911065 RepID=UPI001F231483|nr:histidine phosphotransferase family protein [Zavarzinia marina]MCF4165188.1 histidine phosphotransferase family protein [Zavarzinia marina]